MKLTFDNCIFIFICILIGSIIGYLIATSSQGNNIRCKIFNIDCPRMIDWYIYGIVTQEEFNNMEYNRILFEKELELARAKAPTIIHMENTNNILKILNNKSFQIIVK